MDMKKEAYIYRSPLLYSIAIRILHMKGFYIIKKIVGKRKKVFEPACGFGRLQKYLHPSCSYSGIDLNNKFIEFGKKKGLNIWTGNIFEEKNYAETDIIILSDILHHLTREEINKIITISKKFSKEKIVIMEPAFVGIASGKGIFSKLIAKIFAKIDFDGVNHITHWFTKKEYDELFQNIQSTYKFSNIKKQQIGRYLLVELIL